MAEQLKIFTPQDLLDVLAKWDANPQDPELRYFILSVGKYKWYNWYQCIHIAEGSPADVENTRIFTEWETKRPELHKEVEAYITSIIAMQNEEFNWQAGS